MGDTDKNDDKVSEIFQFIKENNKKPVKGDVKDMYDRLTPLYDKGALERCYSGPSKVAAILNEYCPNKNISILDCGAGTGIVGEELYALGYKNIVGVDLSQKSVDFAKEKGVYEKVICADVEEQTMPFKDGEFDALVCCGGIVPAHISPKVFPEWTRIVKRGGYVVIVTRRCYVELQKDLEDLYSESLRKAFEGEIRKLEDSQKWEVVLQQSFPGYLYQRKIWSDGKAIACKVL